MADVIFCGDHDFPEIARLFQLQARIGNAEAFQRGVEIVLKFGARDTRFIFDIENRQKVCSRPCLITRFA